MPFKRNAAAILILVALIAIGVVPFLIDQPFADQTPRIMAVAFHLRRWSPILSLGGLVVVVAIVAASWRRMRVLGRTAGAIGLVVAGATVWFTRQDPFEWLFNPLPSARYVAASRADFVKPADVVLAVRVGDDAAAYPVRQLAYHHLIN